MSNMHQKAPQTASILLPLQRWTLPQLAMLWGCTGQNYLLPLFHCAATTITANISI